MSWDARYDIGRDVVVSWSLTVYQCACIGCLVSSNLQDSFVTHDAFL